MKGKNDARAMRFFFPKFNYFNSHCNEWACLLVDVIQCAQININSMPGLRVVLLCSSTTFHG
jgi:hypothetical protein